MLAACVSGMGVLLPGFVIEAAALLTWIFLVAVPGRLTLPPGNAFQLLCIGAACQAPDESGARIGDNSLVFIRFRTTTPRFGQPPRPRRLSIDKSIRCNKTLTHIEVSLW